MITPFSRRNAIATCAAFMSGSLNTSTFAQRQEVDAYMLATLATKNLGQVKLATCDDLNASLKRLDDEIGQVKAKTEDAGGALYKQLTMYRKNLLQAVADATKAQVDGKIDETFAKLNMALSLHFIVFGAALTAVGASAIVLGSVTAASGLAGIALFGVQAYFKQGSKNPDFVISFSRDRTIMFTETGAQVVGKTLLENGAKAAALFAAAWDIYQAKNDQELAKKMLDASLKRMNALEPEIAKIGADNKKWGELYLAHLQECRSRLAAYITMTKAANCALGKPVVSKP